MVRRILGVGYRQGSRLSPFTRSRPWGRETGGYFIRSRLCRHDVHEFPSKVFSSTPKAMLASQILDCQSLLATKFQVEARSAKRAVIVPCELRRKR